MKTLEQVEDFMTRDGLLKFEEDCVIDVNKISLKELYSCIYNYTNESINYLIHIKLDMNFTIYL